MTEEWGPWIEHDGMGCPEPDDTIVEVETDWPPEWVIVRRQVGVVGLDFVDSWFWAKSDKVAPIHRYRVRKDKTKPVSLFAHLKQPEDA